MLTFSLIIPVYNEERHIKACLDAVANQTVLPDEVIVVDNNCSDRTIDIANRYDFVTVVKEPQQGRAFARNKGFDSATGDIIGRIDADSELVSDWVEVVKKHFTDDDELYGLTGLAYTPIIPNVRRFRSTLVSRTYYWYVHALFGTITTWGATMAVRKEAWSAVKNHVNTSKIIHEDQDISLWMTGKNMKIIQANDVKIISTNQSFRYLPKFLHYSKMRAATKRFHRKAGNLPAPKELRISWPNRVFSLILALPVIVYGSIGMVLLLPIDVFAIKVLHRGNWFD